MRVTLPKLRCLKDEFSHDEKIPLNLVNGEVYNSVVNGKAVRQHVFVFMPPPYGPQVIGLQFPTFTPKGYTITTAAIVSADYPLADRVLERGDPLIITDNMALLRFIEDSGMFRRTG